MLSSILVKDTVLCMCLHMLCTQRTHSTLQELIVLTSLSCLRPTTQITPAPILTRDWWVSSGPTHLIINVLDFLTHTTYSFSLELLLFHPLFSLFFCLSIYIIKAFIWGPCSSKNSGKIVGKVAKERDN